MIAFLRLLSLVLAVLFFGCENPEPINNNNNKDTSKTNIALVLCEGLYGYDNTTVSKINLLDFSVINDFTSSENPNFRIGDTGNDIIVKGDTFFVVVTTSKAVEYFDLRDGKLLGYVKFEGNYGPRRIAFISDTLALVTDLYADCLHILNISSNKIVGKIQVGPAPEFLAIYKDKAFVANSGYGDFRANEPKAGTFSVVNLKNFQEEKTISVGPNPIEVIVCDDVGSIFVSYNHLPSLWKDSVGGIVEFDLNTLERKREWKSFAPRSLFWAKSEKALYFISNDLIKKIEYNSGKLDTVLVNSKPTEVWYSLALDEYNGLLMIGNAKNYTVEGEVSIYSNKESKAFITTIKVGVNPNKILPLQQK
jgi:hypothetical protein